MPLDFYSLTLDDPKVTLNPLEQLQLQQLLQVQFWLKRAAKRPEKKVDSAVEEKKNLMPLKWELTQDITLHPWQIRCIDGWFSNGKRGVIKVVTGAGKTILALAILERLQQSTAPDLCVAIVVPTIVLLEQWRAEIKARGNIPDAAVGLMGGGHDDGFDGEKRILICVLSSASKKLPASVEGRPGAGPVFLIVDECHRAGASEMQKVFHTKREFSLGLSATPERDGDATEANGEEGEEAEEMNAAPVEFEQTVLGQELGPVVFELNYAEAIERGVLPPFQIVHYGLSLKPPESVKYERLSREITDLRKELERPGRQGLGLIRWCRSHAGMSNPAAARFVGLSAERKRLLFLMEARGEAVLRILQDAFTENPETKAILFHESIDEVMRLFSLLREKGIRVVAEHSEFPDPMRAVSLSLFREGAAQVIVSAKSLIEGFNVPSADLGIIVAATSSVRQRVQTLGRLLRKTRNADGVEKSAVLHVLYAAKTVDEIIYEKADWEVFVGAERNKYFVWPDVQNSGPQPMEKAPRRPPVGELSIDEAGLQFGETYPGDVDQGVAFTRDSQGTIRTEDARLIEPHPELFQVLKISRKSAGRFRVTPSRQYVLELEKTPEGWRGVYLGRLTQPIQVLKTSEPPGPERVWKPGDAYPLSRAIGKTFSVLQRDPRLIALKEKGRARFVPPLSEISDLEKRAAVGGLQGFLRAAYAKGHRISKVSVTEEGHVVYVFANQAIFAGHAPEGVEGFIFEP